MSSSCGLCWSKLMTRIPAHPWSWLERSAPLKHISWCPAGVTFLQKTSHHYTYSPSSLQDQKGTAADTGSDVFIASIVASSKAAIYESQDSGDVIGGRDSCGAQITPHCNHFLWLQHWSDVYILTTMKLWLSKFLSKSWELITYLKYSERVAYL